MAINKGSLYPKFAHSGLKIAHDFWPLTFQAYVFPEPIEVNTYCRLVKGIYVSRAKVPSAVSI